jgi:hypothetical protein
MSAARYLFLLAAFHFAHRARCAAAIRLRAAVDIVLRFPLVPLGTDLGLKPPTLPSAFKAASNCSSLARAWSLSTFNCRTAALRFSMDPLRHELYQRARIRKR